MSADCVADHRTSTIGEPVRRARRPRSVAHAPLMVPGSAGVISDIFEPHPAFDVVDDRRWRSDDFDARCQEAAYCVRWRPMSNSTSSAAGQHRRLQVSARQRLKTERKTERKVAASKPLRTCASVSTQLGYGEVFAAAGLPLAPTWWKAPPSAPGPAVYRGCGVRFADAEAHPRQCAQHLQRRVGAI